MIQKSIEIVSCALMVTAMVFGTFAPAKAQAKSPRKPSTEAASMSAFWETFKAAVSKSDKETVAALSRFPITRNDGMAPIRNKAQLIRHYRALFFGETNAAKCFPEAQPEIAQDWRLPKGTKRPKEFTVSCAFASEGGEEEPFEYRFTQTPIGWRFTSFTNINE